MVDSQMKQDSMLVQKNFTFAAFFMPFYLALPNNCVNTHTHTHTHTHIRATALKQPSRARNIQHKYLQTKGVQEVSHNFMHTLFVWQLI